MKLWQARHHAAPDLSEEQAAIVNAAFSRSLHTPVSSPGTVVEEVPGDTASRSIVVTTLSIWGNFDSFLDVYVGTSAAPVCASHPPAGSTAPSRMSTLDSGNTTLILPYYETLAAMNDFEQLYRDLGAVTDIASWGCNGRVLTGPILLKDNLGSFYSIPNAVFYACNTNNSDGARTSNFGLGVIGQWQDNGWNVPFDGLVLKAPLAYSLDYHCVVLQFDAAQVLSDDGRLQVSQSPALVLSASVPSGYQLLTVLDGKEWMAVYLSGMSMGGFLTEYPAGSSNVVAIDTGGGPTNLTDTGEMVCNVAWPDATDAPFWSNGVEPYFAGNCAVGLQLHDAENNSQSYTIHPASIAQLANACTVFAQKNDPYVYWGGMNAGGVTCLFMNVLVDYVGKHVGFRPKVTPALMPGAKGNTAAFSYSVGGNTVLNIIFQDVDGSILRLQEINGLWRLIPVISGDILSGTSVAAVCGVEGTKQNFYYLNLENGIVFANQLSGQWNGKGPVRDITVATGTGIAAVSWGDLSTICLYFIDASSNLYECRMTDGNWQTPTFLAAAGPASGLAAVYGASSGYIRVYYQDATGGVRELCLESGGSWYYGQFSAHAVAGTALAATNTPTSIDVYYQAATGIRNATFDQSWTVSTVSVVTPTLVSGLSALAAHGNQGKTFFVNCTPQRIVRVAFSNGSWVPSTVTFDQLSS